MAINDSTRTSPPKRRVVGTAGHIDHGKTALVRALTGIDADRLPEEKRRGITIDLGFANLVAGDYQIGFVDVPGHERFVKNMLAGIGGIDSVLLVVSAEESIKPQTREHFAICRLLQIPDGVVAITKSDLVEPEMIDLVRLEVEELLRGSMLEGRPIIAVSSVTGAGIAELREALLESVARAPERDAKRMVFRLPVDRAFTMKGFGSVITGTSLSGELGLDADVEILPEGLRSRARNIQVHGDARESSVAGERTSVNLPDVTLEQLHRGQQIVVPGTLRPSQILTVRLELLPDAPPLKDQSRIRFHHYSAELLGSVRIVDSSGAEIRPGSTVYAQLRLESPVTAVVGDRFVIRRYSPARTIGGGIILDAHMARLRRGTRPEIFTTLESMQIEDRLPLVARLSGLRGVSMRELQHQTGLRIESIQKELPKDPEGLVGISKGADRRWLHRESIGEFRR
ncbi:MAG TPA: selenocysteine-specific translation elongation factor, partial [Thermoanaerobaculia bacterium]|nr:selenocysteine-specific translation elongation factor [Thermoanaerobaculia bacterium]